MELIDREEAIRVLQKLIDARKCDCSTRKIVEKSAFNYCITILNKLPTYESDKDLS